MRRQDIPGQEGLKSVLVRMVDQERLPHAMLLHGTGGGTDLALAHFLVSYLFCDNKDGSGPCGVCANCKRNKALEHPDVHHIYPINTNKKIKRSDKHMFSEYVIDDWREMFANGPYFTIQDWYQRLDIANKQGFMGDLEGKKLREKLSLRAYEGGYKAFIIWGAHKMNPTFANKILKNLEEPSPNTLFILVSDQPDKLLTTILSRVQRFQEEHIQEEDLRAFIQQRFELDEADAEKYAFRAEGSTIAAIKDIQKENDAWFEDFKDWMRMAYQRDMGGLLNWSFKMAGQPRESGRQFIKGALAVLDRSFRMGWVHTKIPMEGEEASFYKNFSPFINGNNIEGFMELLGEASFHIERNVNEKIVWYDTSIKAVRLIHEGKKTPSSVPSN